jgi:hypothetical protein
MTDSGAETSLLAWLDTERASRLPRVAVWEGDIKLPKGKGAALEVTTCTDGWGRTTTARELLDGIAAGTERGERFLEVRLEGDALTVRGLDWREDHERTQDRWVRPVLEAAAALGGKGSVTRSYGLGLKVRDGREQTWVGEWAVKYTAKAGALEVGESKPSAKKAEALLAAIAPAFDAWLAGSSAGRERRARQDHYGYLDTTGGWVLAPRFEAAEAFSEGLASVVEDGERRVIDRQGRVVMRGSFSARPCVNGLFAVNAQVERAVVGDSGERVVVGRDERWGYADAAGTMRIEPTFVEAGPFTGPLAHVKVPEGPFAWYSAFIDRSGKLVGPTRFAGTTGFSEDRAWCYFADTRTAVCIDGTGEPAFGGAFFSGSGFSEGLSPAARASDPTKWGYVDREGRWVIEPRFDRAFEFREGRATVVVGEENFLIDPAGERHGEPFLMAMGLFSEGLMPALRASDDPDAPSIVVGPGKIVTAYFGYLDREGRWAIEPRFPRAHPFHEGRAHATIKAGNDERWGFIDTSGAWVIPPTFHWAERFEHGLAPVRTPDQLYGFVDRDGRWAIAPEWKNLQPAPRFVDGLVWVQHP